MLAAGTRLGPYEIVGSLGAGGMGEVYRARDPRLQRDVALKVLPDPFARDPERIARLQREAEVLATLMHQHIAVIHGMEEFDGGRALVLELVEGETLAERLARGALPVDEAVNTARQLAEALDYAHERGVLHRDLKPANIKLTAQGFVKLLDFGLAKALAAAGSGSGRPGVPVDPAVSATVASPVSLTDAGMILGTAAYMSPEQARGKVVDKRADIWAFGCVGYETLTGVRAFAGDTVSDTIAAVLRADVDWALVPPGTPPALVDLLKRCLTRDVSQRLRDIGDARFELQPERVVPAPVAPSVVERPRMPRAWWLIGAALLGAALASAPRWLTRASTPAAPSRGLIQAELDPGVDPSVIATGPAAVLSPDGTRLAAVARGAGDVPRLFVRRLNDLVATPLPGTEDARNPFFSTDGDWIAFFAQGKLKKVPAAGGTVVTLCDAPNGRGGVWSEDGQIIFNPSSGGSVPLQRVSAAGGSPEPLFGLVEDEVTQRWPQLLPGGRAILYTTAANLGNYTDGQVVVRPLPDGPRKIVVSKGYFGRYLASGHLAYVQQGRLFVVPFDLQRLETTGPAVPLLEQIATGPSTGSAQFAISDVGTAVYVPATDWAKPMLWVAADGSTSTIRAESSDWSNPRFSPDGRRLAYDVWDGAQTDVWVYDLDRAATSRLTFDATEDWTPVWSPDGQWIAYRSARDLAFNLYWQRVDGSGGIERLTTSSNPQAPMSWHPSGRWLVFAETNPVTANDLMLLPFEGPAGAMKPGQPQPLIKTPDSEGEASFSADGHWIAYTVAEAGRSAIYVRAFPGPGRPWLVAPDGTHPTWSPTRPELYFVGTDQRLMVSAYQVQGESFRPEPARRWSTVPLARRTRGQFTIADGRRFDIHPDGRRIVAAPETSSTSTRAVLLLNVFDELRRLAPAR